MAFNRANGRQIREGVITNSHIANNAAIDETKLNIDWDARTSDIFSRKLLIDYVQVEAKAVSAGLSSVTVTGQISATVADADDKKGAVVQSGKNKVILRKSDNGDPIISADGTEVYAKLTHNGTDYSLGFFYKDLGGAEQTFTFTDAAVIDFQFPQRFDFNTVAENFASNEKFVDGASDVSARLDLEQIVADTFGGSYKLNQNGDAARPLTLVQELAQETSGATNTGVKAKNVIDEVVSARGGFSDLNARISDVEGDISTNATSISTLQTEITTARGSSSSLNERLNDMEIVISDEISDRQDADQAIIDDFASTDAGKGASLIGIQDPLGKITATNVEGALAELEGRLTDVEEAGGQEVTDARTSTITGSHASLDARLEEGETRFEAVRTEVEDARKSDAKGTLDLDGITVIPKEFNTIDERIEELEAEVVADTKALDDYKTANDDRVETVETDVADHETRITAVEADTHGHFAEDHNVLAGDPLISTSRYDLKGGETFIVGNKSLQVFFNGFLQMEGIHYTEIAAVGGEGIAISFSPELIQEGDVIQLRWTK